MRHSLKSRPWFARPAGSYLLLLTAIYAACLTASTPPKQESHAVKAKILLSRLSIEPHAAETTSDLRTLLHDLLTLEPVHISVSEPVANHSAIVATRPFYSPSEAPAPYSLFQRPPPSSIL